MLYIKNYFILKCLKFYFKQIGDQPNIAFSMF